MHFFWQGIRRDVPILGFPMKQEVADASSNDMRLETGLDEGFQGIDDWLGDGVLHECSLSTFGLSINQKGERG